ncbi:class-III pyridoxal-phosphate-dependent aminotransferase [Konateibacter massiliensis]|uniref:class-III pyridoxal-phosphate-dependent aminotransferase n=1 Tax=Konateibacter massiliensis TaxID=2002841 RepID=UPI0015D4BF59|nr:aspartate aminotransferase family protein [Konateibacter massiliensis]
MKTLNCNYEVLNPTIVSGDNCYVFDEKEKKYLDFESGVWCTALGHNNPQINEAIISQLKNISHTGYRYTTKVVDEAAGKVLELLHFNEGKCVFLSSGSEAVEFGVQLAKKIMEKPYFLCLNNYFLSSYGISATRNKEEWISLDLSKYDGNIDEFLADVPFDKIGAFIFEPGNASGTVKLPEKALIKEIADKVKSNGGIIVVDEVTTGTGRTGKWFGFEHYDIHPDIISIGKGIGNGYPVSVVALSKEISDAAEKSGFKYAQSHQNDPLGCTVVKTVVSTIESGNLIQRASKMGTILDFEFNSLSQKYKCIKEVRGVGLMFVIEFEKDIDFPLEKVHKELFEAGYIVGANVPANLLRFYPPLTIEETQIKSLVNALETILLRYIS